MSTKEHLILGLFLSYYYTGVFPELANKKNGIVKRVFTGIFWPIKAKKNNELPFRLCALLAEAIVLAFYSTIIFSFVNTSIIGISILIGFLIIPVLNGIVIIPSTLLSIIFWMPTAKILGLNEPTSYLQKETR